MTLSDKEKLAEMKIEADSVDEYSTKLIALQETYFAKRDENPLGDINEDLDSTSVDKEVTIDPLIAAALQVTKTKF